MLNSTDFPVGVEGERVNQFLIQKFNITKALKLYNFIGSLASKLIGGKT
jgi:hypothetical protein